MSTRPSPVRSFRTTSSTSVSPRPTRVPTGRAAAIAMRPDTGATTSALPPARGWMVAGASITARRGCASTFIVAKSSVHCCSLRKEIAPSSSAACAASAVFLSGCTVAGPTRCSSVMAPWISTTSWYRRAAGTLTSTPKMPGVAGPSTSNRWMVSPSNRTTTRPSRSGLKLVMSVRWMAKRACSPATSGGYSMKSSVRGVHVVTAIAGGSASAAGGSEGLSRQDDRTAASATVATVQHTRFMA